MITYELAKKLKKAGFRKIKFSDNHEDFGIVCRFCGKRRGDRPDKCYMKWENEPDLSELIEACKKTCFKIYCCENKYAIALEGRDTEDQYDSPEEAVANLWLKLNKK